jgi:hypothetical protein
MSNRLWTVPNEPLPRRLTLWIKVVGDDACRFLNFLNVIQRFFILDAHEAPILFVHAHTAATFPVEGFASAMAGSQMICEVCAKLLLGRDGNETLHFGIDALGQRDVDLSVPCGP